MDKYVLSILAPRYLVMVHMQHCRDGAKHLGHRLHVCVWSFALSMQVLLLAEYGLGEPSMVIRELAKLEYHEQPNLHYC